MKRFFRNSLCVALLIAGAVACNKELAPPTTPQSKAITFGSVETRVESADEMNEFGVFAQQNLGKDDDPASLQWLALLEEERVYRTNSGWTYDNTRYWVDDRTFFFWAYYPYVGTTATRTTETTYVNFNGESQPKTISHFTLNVAVPYAADADYMVAQAGAITTTAPYPSSVDFEFEHLLSKIVFNIKKSGDFNANDKFIVTQVGLTGVSRNGTYVATHTPGSSYKEEFTPTTESRQVRRSNLNKELTTGGVDVTSGGFYMLPQTLAGDQVKLSIAYTYQQGGNGEVQYLTVEKAIPAGEWVKEKVYTYTLELAIDNNIYISTPTVSSWGSMQTGGTIIIQ